MTNCQDEYCVVGFFVAVKSNVARLPARNNKRTKALLHGSANHWMIGENVYGLRNKGDGGGCGSRICFEEEVCESVEVAQRLTGVDHLRQGLALGFRAAWPEARRLRYACTSEARYPTPDFLKVFLAFTASETNSARRSAA